MPHNAKERKMVWIVTVVLLLLLAVMKEIILVEGRFDKYYSSSDILFQTDCTSCCTIGRCCSC